MQVAAGVVELCLGLAQHPRTAACRDLGVAPITPAEGHHRLTHGIEFLEFPSEIFELAHGFSHILQCGAIERGQGIGQGIGEALFVGLLGKLRLAELDQRVDQRRVTLRAEAEQPFVDRTAIVPCRAEHLSPRADRLGKPLARKDGTFGRGEPQVDADALICDEEPRLHAAAARHCAQPAAQRECLQLAATVAPAKLDPGVADAPFVAAAHEQVPVHALVAVAVRLDPRGAQIRIKQEWQR